MLDSCSIDTLSIEIYESQIVSFDFIPICLYMFELSFLTTLNIYKDYFKGCHSRCKCMQLNAKKFHKHIVTETYALVYLSLQEAAEFVRCRDL